jgi:acetyl-CoA synthetase
MSGRRSRRRERLPTKPAFDFIPLSCERFNLAEALFRRHADRLTRVALLDVKPLADNCYTFGGLDFLSDKFASTLTHCGIVAGDTVAMTLDQSAALVVAELGSLKCGAAAVPLPQAFDLSDVEWAVNDSGAKALIAPFERRDDYAAIARRAPSITALFLAGEAREAIHYEGEWRSFWREVFLAPSDFNAVATEAAASAFIFYAKTAGGRRRVAHSHGAMLDRLVGFEKLNGQAAGAGGALWCGDDWAAADLRRGLIYPAWWHGCAVVTRPPDGLTRQQALQVFERSSVTMAFVRPALLNELLRGGETERAGFELRLRTVIARNEAITANHGQQLRAVFGATLRGVSQKPDSGLIVDDEVCE